MKLSTLMERCLSIPYTSLSEGADYAAERLGDVLYLYLEKSSGAEDWKNNLDVSCTDYQRPDGSVGRCHRGFLRVWRALEGAILPLVRDGTLQGIVTVGYSHGGALAVLCHEAVRYERPDLREHIFGVGFGAPRVICGALSAEEASPWERFLVVRNREDPVTYLPPALLGYTHVGNLLEIGQSGRYQSADAHRAENILAELLRYEKTKTDR